MPTPPKILAFAGSTREGSYNKQLLKLAAAAASKAGGDVQVIDLRDFPLPIYDGDLESREGLPENARKLKQLFISHQAILISSPEYNSSVSGVLKNAIDWVSRPAPGEAPLAGFEGKVAGLLSTSPGALGGLRGLVQLRAILGNIRVLVLPDQVAVSRANEAFDAEGRLKDPKLQASVEKLAEKLVDHVRKLAH
ncbi:MAG TPA: NAD(P)H-dependent oxidoreductase [Planctomycetota bacterium]|nr:NAD(P)H-dependent oxidoreductase [Planctomycetota bacterium]